MQLLYWLENIFDLMNKRLTPYRKLTGNMLKIIAVAAMVIDHFCKIVLQWLLSNYWGNRISYFLFLISGRILSYKK